MKHSIFHLFKKIIFILFALGVVGTFFVAAIGYWFVVVQPGDEILQGNLKKVLAVESPVYYSDGVSPVGVFFQSDHRQYIPYELMPANFVKAIIAAEDHSFFTHCGIDFLGIMRAMIENLKAGRVVQGGSTLTQQAAKNLFKRKDRSVGEKLKELLYALRLEYHYSKEKILEFYANQFFVSGNGRGLGVAAKYYFAKSATDLTLLESAFIAGSVKRPNYYNPFIKKDEASVKNAIARSKRRTAYVLNQMFNMGMINRTQLQENLQQDIPFKKGRVSYALNTVMDLVREALAEPEIEEAMVAHGIDNVATSGVKIYTTIDKKMQQHSLTVARRELSRLSVRLRGYEQRALQEQYGKLASNAYEIKDGNFMFARIIAIDSGEKPLLTVSLGKGRKSVAKPDLAFVDHDGLQGLVAALVRYEGQRWSEPSAADYASLLKDMQVGDLLYVSIRSVDDESGKVLLDIEKYPTIQGAFIVLQNGAIRAMVGGHENRYFNRAIDARRLMGSVTKPLLYSAAIQLGWNAMDLIKNERDAFVYHNQVYFPRPDHISPFQWVSLNWAGIKSENVASVWLLYNLCDRLSPGQFKEVAAELGLGRFKDESYQQYRSRIRDDLGVLVNGRTLRNLAFESAVQKIGPDLLFDGMADDYDLLGRFHYSLVDDLEEDDTSHEAEVRRGIIKKSFVQQKKLYGELQRLREWVSSLAEIDGFGPGASEYWQNPDGPWLFVEEFTGRYIYAAQSPGVGWDKLAVLQVAHKWQDSGQQAGFWDDIMLDGLLHASTVSQLDDAIEWEYQRLSALPAYGSDVLYRLRDFRVLVGLRYVIGLAREMGVRSNLEPVLSFPLGSNVITLLEVAKLYESMVTGIYYRSGRSGASEGIMLIDRIENSDGEVVYKTKRVATKILDDKTSLAISDLLRSAVRNGTGRYAYKTIRMHSSDPQIEQLLQEMDIPVPTLGKTGTANKFRNSTFAGYLPGVVSGKERLGLKNGYTMAAYIGFDNNESMVRSSTHITGSSGGLRLWTDMANFIIKDKKYAEQFDLDSLSFSAALEVPLVYPDLGQVRVAGGQKITAIADFDSLLAGSGLDTDKVEVGPATIAFGEVGRNGELKAMRHFKPFWRVKQ